jgi:hypothetical protein
MFSKASTKAKERRVKKKFPILPFIIIVIILVLVSKKTKAVAAEIQETVVVDRLLDIPVLSSLEVAEEVVRRRIFWWRIWRRRRRIGGGFGGGSLRWLEWRLVKTQHSIMKAAIFFHDYLCHY